MQFLASNKGSSRKKEIVCGRVGIFWNRQYRAAAELAEEMFAARSAAESTLQKNTRQISAKVMEGNQATPEDMKEELKHQTIIGNETQEQQGVIAEKITEKEPKVLLFERPRLADHLPAVSTPPKAMVAY